MAVIAERRIHPDLYFNQKPFCSNLVTVILLIIQASPSPGIVPILFQPHMASWRGYRDDCLNKFRQSHTVAPQTTQRPSKAASYKACYGVGLIKISRCSKFTFHFLCSTYRRSKGGSKPVLSPNRIQCSHA